MAALPTPPGFTDAEVEEMDRSERIVALEPSGWLSNQRNGPGWTGITCHLLRRDELSETAWIEQCWSIEHNNATWMDKIDIQDSERGVVREVAATPFAHDLVDPVIFDALRGLLDAARDGDKALIFDYAVQYGNEAGVNLRRLRTMFGL